MRISVSCQEQKQNGEVKIFLDCIFSLDTAIRPLFNIQQLARTVSLMILVSGMHFFAPWQQQWVILGTMRS